MLVVTDGRGRDVSVKRLVGVTGGWVFGFEVAVSVLVGNGNVGNRVDVLVRVGIGVGELVQLIKLNSATRKSNRFM